MITLYSLKQNSCFRCCYKAPAYIKNIFLMIMLACLLFIIHVVYFRSDGGSILSAVNILKGLNSNTFNYLQSNSLQVMKLQQGIKNFSKQTVTSMQFFSECIKFNKPCFFKDLAKSWPATSKWDSALKQRRTTANTTVDATGMQYLQ